jgi:hypothetical protein
MNHPIYSSLVSRKSVILQQPPEAMPNGTYVRAGTSVHDSIPAWIVASSAI